MLFLFFENVDKLHSLLKEKDNNRQHWCIRPKTKTTDPLDTGTKETTKN